MILREKQRLWSGNFEFGLRGFEVIAEILKLDGNHPQIEIFAVMEYVV